MGNSAGFAVEGGGIDFVTVFDNRLRLRKWKGRVAPPFRSKPIENII